MELTKGIELNEMKFSHEKGESRRYIIVKKQVLKISLPVKKRPWMDGIFSQIQNLSPPFNPIYSLGFVMRAVSAIKSGCLETESAAADMVKSKTAT